VDAGLVVVGEGEGEHGNDAGVVGEGEGEGEHTDAGIPQRNDAGTPAHDAGILLPFDAGGLDSLRDGGVLSCVPTQIPQLSLTGILGFLNFSPYQGAREDGVVCGDTTCAHGVPCCVACGFSQCGDVDGNGNGTCPALMQKYQCDGAEDCPSGDPAHKQCCASLAGTDCRAKADCDFSLTQLTAALDGGTILPDAGLIDGGPAGVATQIGDLLNQGVPVCRSSFTDCNIFQANICCTSSLFQRVDLGVCVPAPVCLGSILP
jgi:hypothetical protein